MPPSVATRSREVVSQGLADQLGPLLRLHEELQRSATISLDLDRAVARFERGQPAFDPYWVLRDGREFQQAFMAAVKAFERSGMATTSAATALRQQQWNADSLVLAWVSGERPSVEPVQQLARKAAALVGNATLARAADLVAHRVNLSSWTRPVCPCCGGAPDLASGIDAQRTLLCARCNTRWRCEQAGCLGCGTQDEPTIARIRSPFLGYVLTICNSCGRYLKERASGEGFHPIVERALTEELDAAAEQRGLRN